MKHSRTIGWSNEQFERVATVAYRVAGLVFPTNRQASAESAMRRVMATLRLETPAALLHEVGQPGEARDALLAELTVGESYFFREAGALSVLEREIIDARRSPERQDEPLRIWSAGCATGEEPYTLAMLLRELGWAQPAHILGTDISRPRLDAARRGRYTQWSLRGVSSSRVERWFSARGKHFIVDESIRAAVQFQSLNLVSDEYPSSRNGTAGQDLILCRNVLIYFDLPTVAQIATQLLRALRPDGWLLLGASDPPLADLVDCRTSMTPSGVVYQRADGEPRAHVARTPLTPAWHHDVIAQAVIAEERAPSLPKRSLEPVPPMYAESAPLAVDVPTDAVAAYAGGDYATASRAAELALARDGSDASMWVTWIRALANTGQLARAGEVAAAAIDRHRLEPELQYLHGMLLLEGGSVAEGARAARRALYLDRSFVIGYMLLGDALSRLADMTGSRHAFENAVRLIDRLTPGAAIAGADGVSTVRMRQIAVERLRTIAPSP
ncbi:MAG: protein-glutamate O-methyltransferase CheR [bacterium]